MLHVAGGKQRRSHVQQITIGFAHTVISRVVDQSLRHRMSGRGTGGEPAGPLELADAVLSLIQGAFVIALRATVTGNTDCLRVCLILLVRNEFGTAATVASSNCYGAGSPFLRRCRRQPAARFR